MPGRLLLALLVATTTFTPAQRTARVPLGPADIEDIAQLLMIEDARAFDEAALARMLRSTHQEVRRRAALAIGRLADPRGLALLERTRTDAAIAREVAFAYGQLKDGAAVPWLADRLTAPNVPEQVRQEAARSLGKIRTPEARAALVALLRRAQTLSSTAAEALLSLGRFPAHGEDLAPIQVWMFRGAGPTGVTWQAAWALYRPRDPAGVPDLLRLSSSNDPEVRFWAVRGLAAPPDGVTPIVDEATRSARLRQAAQDPDRRVRTEALRALATYDDDASFAMVLGALDSPDTWLSVSAAEAMPRYASRRDVVVPRLVAASEAERPTALRVTALNALVTLAPEAAVDLAASLTTDTSLVARSAARQALGRLGDARRARLEALPVDPEVPNPAPRGNAAGARGGGAAGRAAAPPDTLGRTIDDYRRIAMRWVVGQYNGEIAPVATWETPRGTIEIALHAADAPLAMEYLVRATDSGELVGTEFGRLVPNFVAQQRTIRNASRLRDEVNLYGLRRGTLSWASGGLDTGRPGFTLGHTPQPHNEGDFTAFGHVVRGLEVMDRLELGDRIISASLRAPR